MTDNITLYEVITLFIFGLLLLIKGGDLFVDSACGIAKRFHLPEILIGATVVSIGTTLPEVMVSSTAAIGGSGSIAYGNAIGSIICNASLVAAVTIAVKPSNVDKKTFLMPVIFFYVAIVLYSVVAYVIGEFNRFIGISLLVIFVVYMAVTIIQAVKNPQPQMLEGDEVGEEKAPAPLWKNIILLIVGAGFIAWGADLLVDNGIRLAQSMGVPETVIALTFVALGTSLPELVTAITSLVKGHGSLSLGNIIGANLFNLVLVTGMASTIGPFVVPQTSVLFGMNASLVLDIPVAIAVMSLLTVPTLIKGKLYRWQGISLLVIYFTYVVLQFTVF